MRFQPSNLFLPNAIGPRRRAHQDFSPLTMRLFPASTRLNPPLRAKQCLLGLIATNAQRLVEGGSLKKIGKLIFLFGIITALRAGSLLDPTFNIGSGANGIVEQVLPLSSGKILICGNFTSFNGKNRGYIARLNSDGSVDESFLGQPGYWVRHMAVQADGKIVIGGYFKNVGSTSRSLVARLNADGSLDTSFDPGLGCTDIIAGGIDGNIDPFVFWLVVQGDGKIILTGNFRNYNGQSSIGIVRVNADGSRDTSFNVGSGLDSWGRHMLIQPNGQILVAGWFTSYNGQSFNRLMRLNPDGTADHSFNPYFGDKTAIYTTALVANGKFIAAGHSINPNGLFLREIERLNPDGSVDSSWVGYTNDKTESSVVQSDGKLIVGGAFTSADGTSRTSLARFNTDGTLDTGFQANIDNFVWTVALDANGKLLISGGFYTVDGVSMSGVARLLTGVGGGTPPPSDTAPVLSASAASTSQINLTWTDASTIRTGYSVERKTGSGGTYAQIATLAASARSYSATGLSAGTQYYFRLLASNNQGRSLYSNEANATTQSSTGTTSNSASFAGSDSATRGTWKGAYGSDGYNVIADTIAYPAYAQVTPSGKSDWTWQWSTTDTDALQRATGTDRVAACWYASSSFSVDVSITDGQSHRVSLYCLDWDLASRSQTVEAFDGDTGTLLDRQSISSFVGVYLNYTLKGHVKFLFTRTGGPNAVLSGIFFGGASTTTSTVGTPVITPNGGTYSSAQSVTITDSTTGAEIHWTADGSDPTTSSALYSGPLTITASATLKAKAFKSGMTASATASAAFTISSGTGTTGAKFVYAGADTSTLGNWRGKYGADGYNVIGKAVLYPSYATVAASSSKQDWVWNDPTTDARALQTPDGTSREAGCWYSSTGFDIDLNFTDGKTHRLAAYFCDWDYAGRSEKLELLDAASGTVLQTLTLSSFSGGQYQIWDIKGHVKLRLTRIAGPNAVVNGLFLQAAAAQL